MANPSVPRFSDYTAGAVGADITTAEVMRLAMGVLENCHAIHVETGGNLHVGYAKPSGGVAEDTFPVDSGQIVTGNFAIVYTSGTTAQGLRLLWL
jgi:hypothetical protein